MRRDEEQLELLRGIVSAPETVDNWCVLAAQFHYFHATTCGNAERIIAEGIRPVCDLDRLPNWKGLWTTRCKDTAYLRWATDPYDPALHVYAKRAARGSRRDWCVLRAELRPEDFLRYVADDDYLICGRRVCESVELDHKLFNARTDWLATLMSLKERPLHHEGAAPLAHYVLSKAGETLYHLTRLNVSAYYEPPNWFLALWTSQQLGIKEGIPAEQVRDITLHCHRGCASLGRFTEE